MGLLLGVLAHTTFILQRTTERQGRTTTFLGAGEGNRKKDLDCPRRWERCWWLLKHEWVFLLFPELFSKRDRWMDRCFGLGSELHSGLL